MRTKKEKRKKRRTEPICFNYQCYWWWL